MKYKLLQDFGDSKAGEIFIAGEQDKWNITQLLPVNKENLCVIYIKGGMSKHKHLFEEVKEEPVFILYPILIIL